MASVEKVESLKVGSLSQASPKPSASQSVAFSQGDTEVKGVGQAIKEWWHETLDYLDNWRKLPDPEEFLPQLCDNALWVIPKHSNLRHWLVTVVHWRVFELITLLAILANCVTLALDSKVPGYQDTKKAQQLRYADYVFTGFFTVEALLKIGAWGFLLAPDTYLRSGWNILDFVIVVTGYISLVGFANVTGLRGIRALRPLRTITRIKEMKNLVGSIIACLPMLVDVVILTSFYFIIFGIMSVQLFGGVMRYRCSVPVFDGASTNGMGVVQGVEYYVPESEVNDICKHPKVERITWHNKTDPDTGSWELAPSGLVSDPWARTCPGPSDELPYGMFCTPFGNPGAEGFGDQSIGYSSFDNILLAFLSIFQYVTLQDWSFIMYRTQDAVHWWTWPLHYTMFLLGGVLIINLILAIIYVNYQKQQEEKLEAVLRTISETGSLTQEQIKALQGMNLGKRNQSLANLAKDLNKSGSTASGKLLLAKLQSSKTGTYKSSKMGSGKLGSLKKMGQISSIGSVGSMGSIRSSASQIRGRELGRQGSSMTGRPRSRELCRHSSSLKGKPRPVGEGVEGEQCGVAAVYGEGPGDAATVMVTAARTGGQGVVSTNAAAAPPNPEQSARVGLPHSKPPKVPSLPLSRLRQQPSLHPPPSVTAPPLLRAFQNGISVFAYEQQQQLLLLVA
mmetsp:Transcript_9389/g.23891  ORF Transcript_9389/g.23891 Transcript_9389/m.23891 type:complete len:677 (+) Transcript_9389:82-2112(+)